MAFAPPARHLLRAKDLADARYFESLGVDDLARVAGLSRAPWELAHNPHWKLTADGGVSLR